MRQYYMQRREGYISTGMRSLHAKGGKHEKGMREGVKACLSFQQGEDPRKLPFPLQSSESSEFIEVVQIDLKKV